MKKCIHFSFLFLAVLGTNETCAQEIFKLWEGIEKPFYKENQVKEFEEERWGSICALNVTEPTLTVYKAEGHNSGKAIIIMPGGGYTAEVIYHEGYDVAELLSQKGITAAVLKYRLPSPETSDYPERVPLTDARRALKLLRENAKRYGLEVDKIGLMGFSAGSHLATVASLWNSEDPDENPNFSVLVYGVTNMTDENIKWLEESLYYRKLTEEELAQNTLLKLVSKNTPPAFLVHAYDDNICNVNESTLYAEKLRKNNVPVEMHLFPRGGHGFGSGRAEDGTDQWLELCVNWLKTSDF